MTINAPCQVTGCPETVKLDGQARFINLCPKHRENLIQIFKDGLKNQAIQDKK